MHRHEVIAALDEKLGLEKWLELEPRFLVT